MSPPVLAVEGLKTHFFTARGRRQGGRRRQLHGRPRRGARAGRRIGLRQDRHRLVHPRPARSAGTHRRRLDPARTARSWSALRKRSCAHYRGRKIAMIFQDPMMTLNPVLRIDTQMIEAITAHEKVSQRAARGARARGARRRRHRVARGAAARLSAPVLRRHAPAGRDRDRAAAPAAAPDRRRADDRARRHHPVADPRRGAGAVRADRHRADLDHARSCGRSPGSPTASPSCMRAASSKQGPVDAVLGAAAASLYARPDRLGADAAAARRAAGRRFRACRPRPRDLPPGCAFAPRCARADAAVRDRCRLWSRIRRTAPTRCWHPMPRARCAA